KVRDLASAAEKLGMPAVALTDRCNLFGLVKFYQACIDVGVKPLIGTDLWFRNAEGLACRVSVLAMDQAGYDNLLFLVSAAYTHTQERGYVTRERLFERNGGLLVLCGGLQGEIGQALIKGSMAQACELATLWSNAFPDRIYLELVRNGRPLEEDHVAGAVDLAARLELPVVATNDVCFLNRDDFEAHETRVCIQDGRVLDDPRRERRYSADQYLRSAGDMRKLFRDVPEALVNTVEVARRCNVQLGLDNHYLPNYPVPDGTTLSSFLERTAQEGLEARLTRLRERNEVVACPAGDQVGTSENGEGHYHQRLEYELDVINQMGFPGYFLIVMEFIAWAKENNIPVCPRGSGAGSLVAYALGITEIDPLRYDLLFERFLNPERVSMPDFDIDFCMEGRDKVIHHVSERYSADAVSQIITFGTMAAKAVVRDVARVQGKPYGLADKLSKLIPFEVGITLTRAVEQTKELREFIAGNDEVGEIMDMAYRLEGIVRNVGRHAGGVVIAPSRLTDFVPLYVDESSGGLVSQFDKDDVERAGLVKFDFLGLKTLTIIDWAVQAVNAASGHDVEPIDVHHIPLDDKATYELLRSGETIGIFQLESRGMRDLIRRLLPDQINDIIALVALFRPGPLQSGAVDDYIDRKHGKAKIDYPHPSLQPVLRDTYGVMLYQEQVMSIAQVLCGFSLGQADLLRRAMGKKKPEEMAKVRQQFVDGAAARGIDTKLTEHIFGLVEKFAGYAFNKSHSATYAMVSFQTAWLKTHYPAQFMAATMSADMQNTDRVVTLVDEVRRMGIELMPPTVNHSRYRFTVHNDVVMYGLGAVRGIGEGPVLAVEEARTAEGPFKNLVDFCNRVGSRKANKRVLDALIRSGAMDDFSHESEALDSVRARLLAELNDAMQGAEQEARDSAFGMSDMFGGVSQASVLNRLRSDVVPLTKKERLQGERETLGLYLTGHPIEDYLEEIHSFCPTRIVQLRCEKRSQLVAGLVVSARTMRSRRGGSMGFVVMDDRSGRIEASLFPDVYEVARSKIAKDAVLVLEGEVQPDDFTGSLKLRVDKVYTIDEARQRFSIGVEIDFRACAVPGDLATRLRACLESFRVVEGGSPVAVLYQAGDGQGTSAQGRILLGPQWNVRPSDDLLERLRSEFGVERVNVSYPGR
ncbi:MAG: DNA polymerase III subunit alpha, partial [Gammaproteobacteria bacterium]|nr:DNA polymerase III subunit alpha [Gammaproteobacteria bacterium]